MLRAYFDDSGSDAQSSFYILAGYLSTVEKWDAFSDRWKEVLQAYPKIDYFKMREAEGLSKEFGGWTRASADGKIKALANVIRKHALFELSCMLPRDLHDHFIHPTAPREVFKNPYFVCYSTLIAILSGFNNYMGVGGEIVDVIFDKQSQVEPIIAMFHADLRTRQPFNEIVGSIEFKDDKDAVQLQAADFLAWSLRRFCVDRELRLGMKEVLTVPNVRIQPTAQMVSDLATAFISGANA